jgi:catechol 2,3-dioxygenase-like lactoylglutathione lyase family enzyme
LGAGDLHPQEFLHRADARWLDSCDKHRNEGGWSFSVAERRKSMTAGALLEGILETALYAADLDAAEAFYEGILGLEKIARSGNRHVFFRCGPGVLLIFNPDETVKPPAADALQVPPHGTRGEGHACFRVSGENLDAMAASLRTAGVAIESEVHWPQGGRSIYFRDPAGNSLECAEARIWGITQDS